MQHREVLSLRHQLAMSRGQHVAAKPVFRPLVADARVTPSGQPVRTANVSYGWGAL